MLLFFLCVLLMDHRPIGHSAVLQRSSVTMADSPSAAEKAHAERNSAEIKAIFPKASRNNKQTRTTMSTIIFGFQGAGVPRGTRTELQMFTGAECFIRLVLCPEESIYEAEAI